MTTPGQPNEQDGTRGAYASYLTRSAQQDALTKFLADDMGMELHDAHLLAAEITLSRWFDDVREEAKAEALREAADRAVRFAQEAYGSDLFARPTSEDYAEVRELLKSEHAVSLDRISADVMSRAITYLAQRHRQMADAIEAGDPS